MPRCAERPLRLWLDRIA